MESNQNQSSTQTAVATLAGGCFWCLEAVYNDLKGVQEVVSGYAGGHVPSPTYRQVCGGDTGHAEVVQITYDPHVINYKDLLEVFFSIHDPTTLNRQGNDIGPQYRSAIFYRTEEEKQTAERMIQSLERAGVWGRPIVTEVSPFKEFYPAEEYHQRYFERNPYQSYCQIVIAPKVSKFRKQHIERLKK